LPQFGVVSVSSFFQQVILSRSLFERFYVKKKMKNCLLVKRIAIAFFATDFIPHWGSPRRWLTQYEGAHGTRLDATATLSAGMFGFAG
jgi:hypothetical protein